MPSTVQVSASVLAADLADLRAACQTVLDAGADMLHIDVMDGHFVPNISYGAPVLKCLHKALPDAFYDVHLMITDPLKYLPDFAAAGADLVTFHYEAMPDAAAVHAAIAAVHAAGCKAGLSVKPATPAAAALPFVPELDLVLVMSVEPGFGGQAFMPEALAKLRALRDACRAHGVWLEVDGGVDAVTGPQCTAAGADVLVTGSALFKAPDPAALLAALRR